MVLSKINIMKVLDLNGIWFLKGYDVGKGDEEKAFEFDYDDSDWTRAHVPGVVHLDLLRLKGIQHPFYRTNELDARWVEGEEWWYRKGFTVGGDLLDYDRIELAFEGLDTFAKVWLNGKEVGVFDNMFYEQSTVVNGLLRKGENVIAIRFDPPTKVLEGRYGKSDVKLGAAFYPPRVCGRKAQYSFGWDWGPRLATSGIWKPVWIRGYSVCKIDSFYFRAQLSEAGGATKVEIEVTMDAFKEEDVNVSISLKGHGYVGVKNERRKLSLGENRFAFELAVDDPVLWWPNGCGGQALYDLYISVTKEDVILDKRNKRVGIRKIEVVREGDEEGETFYFKVNGVPIFCKGANWIPADSFLPQVTRDRYDYLLGKADEANMNMLRIWGGGVYEDEAFYEICDERGIMVWQDFMFACAEYPEEGWFLDEVKREAEEVVKRLRNHACMALWCGNNENDWGVKANWFGKKDKFYGHTIYHEILPEVCGRLDPSTFYWPSSPYGGDDPNSQSVGDRHSWDVWSGLRDYTEYLRDNGRFVSEFGFQSLPSVATIMKFTAPEDRYPQSKVLEHHNKQDGGPQRLISFLSNHFKVPSDLRTYSYLTQVNQGEAMKAGILHWRRRMYKSAGALIWQLDDCWPVSSWSLIDYYGGLKASYYYTRRAFDNVTLSLVSNGGFVEAWVINDLPEERTGAIEITAFRLDGEKVYDRTVGVRMPPNSSTLVTRVSIPDMIKFDPSNAVIVGALRAKGLDERRDVISLDEWKHMAFPEPKIKLTALKVLDEGKRRYELRVVSNAFVKACKIEVRGMEAFFSDNCYDMIPKVERSLVVTLERPLKPSELKKRVQFIYYR